MERKVCEMIRKRIIVVMLCSVVAWTFSAASGAVLFRADISGYASVYAASRVSSGAAKKKYVDASRAAAKAKKRYRDAQSATAGWKTRYDRVYPSYRRGSVGFFESVGAKNALNELNTCKYSSYIRTADKGASEKDILADATALDHMADSFSHMEYMNHLRKSLGLSELRITDTMMARAQADADYSDRNIGHAEQFPVAENVAWNGGSNPYYQWYDNEKKIYDAGTRDFSRVGHYLNCINPEYEVTGYGICSRGSLNGWITFAQVFGFDTGEASYTVEQYEARFRHYAGSMIDTVENYHEAVRTEKERKSAYSKALKQKKAAYSAYQKARKGR